MPKIQDLPKLAAPDASEQIVVEHGGQTYRAQALAYLAATGIADIPALVFGVFSDADGMTERQAALAGSEDRRRYNGSSGLRPPIGWRTPKRSRSVPAGSGVAGQRHMPQQMMGRCSVVAEQSIGL